MKTVNKCMFKALKLPQITTVWPLNDRADTTTTLAKIKAKLERYKCISPREQEYLDRFGKIDQKNTFS